MYYLLTENFKIQEEKLVQIINTILPAEKIYLLGSTLSQRRTETVFMPNAPSRRHVSHYYLLVLVDANCGYSNNQLQDRIENSCRSFIPVTTIVLHTQQFANWLQAGQRFATTVIERAVLIHGGNNILFEVPQNVKAIDDIENKKWNDQQQTLVKEFIAGAELYITRKQNNIALFMLHQATEQFLHLLLQSHTGLHINTHNIDKLLRYCSMVSFTIPEIFDRKNEKEEQLFQLLQGAYIGSRYKKENAISTKNVLLLLDRIKIFSAQELHE